METEFQRAKSEKNKKIRLQHIMEVTDQLFHQYTYHDITLTTIAKELNLARGGLYKYVSTKEDIFLMIYLEKQQAFLNELLDHHFTDTKSFALTFSQMLAKHMDLLKYHQILNAIIETNVSVEKLAEFKYTSHQQQLPLLTFFQTHYACDEAEAFDFYLTFLYHGVYLYDRVAYQDLYRQAMEIAGLKIYDIDFVSHMTRFILLHLH